MKQKIPNSLKTFLEFAPLIVFFLAFKLNNEDLIISTKYLMGSSIITLAIVYFIEKTVPKVMLYGTILIVICGATTIITNNPVFIKMKPTILYILIGSTLLIGLIYKKIFLKNMLEKVLTLSDEDWYTFSKRWSYFFFFLAILNEAIWRNFSDYLWIKFKLFGLPICIFVFLIANAGFFKKNHGK